MYSSTKKSRFALPGLAILFVGAILSLMTTGCSDQPKQDDHIIQFVYTSDTHLGIARETFQGDSNVYSNVVNTAMVKQMNSLPYLTLPNDDGVRAGEKVGGIDYFINTGDIANRQEAKIQDATTSWGQFEKIYLQGLNLKNNHGQKTTVFLLPGNHDITDALGFYREMHPPKDNGSLVGIYNYMFPSTPKTAGTYNYATDKVHYSRNIGGLHFLFVNMWADSAERVWIEKDLANVSDTTPVLMFQHDEPNVESKHFTNPNGKHDINSTDRFENLLAEVFKGGTSVEDSSTIEQREFAQFLKKHKNIEVYFHGNDNENRYYDYYGPDHDVDLKVIQVDSPMKGNISRHDETKLSFQLVTIDTRKKLLTVRECLWNTDPSHPEKPIVWGESETIQL